MTNQTPDYNLLIAVYVAVLVLYFCVQELLITYLFTDKEKEELMKIKNENKEN